jgi:signal transduction histidine kinase
MGTHGAASVRTRALPPGARPVESTTVDPATRRPLLNLSNWPVARRFFAVIIAALLMGVVFGGLWVASAEGNASQYSRVSKLAALNQTLIVCVNALQNERDTALLLSPTITSASQQQTTMAPFFATTTAAVAAVRQAAAGVGGLPANIQGDVAQVLSDITPIKVHELHENVSSAQDDLAITDSYGTVISDMITLSDQVGQGVSDGQLTGDVQALNALALAKEQASQQRGLLNSALSAPVRFSVSYAHDGGTARSPLIDTANQGTEQALTLASAQETADLAIFFKAASELQAVDDVNEVNFPAGAAATNIAQDIEGNVFVNDDTDYFIDGGTTDTDRSVPGSQLIASLSGVPLQPGPAGSTELQQGLATWDLGMGDDLTAMQHAETVISNDIVSRAGQLHSSAQRSALTFGLITLVVLLVVLVAALAVARSLVRPLRRLRAGALDIASTQLPERVRLLTESPDAAASMAVAPINVVSGDEIGEVARAFDQVHAEAVRLAGEQALLRSTFNAMFVNLSRRSQSLNERLARMIDNLEQTEADPDRLGSLFSMDHLVTRMRRNSENLLLLAGHESPRKWSEPVPLSDVVRAATSEIEQYNRVRLNIPAGIAVIGPAVSDVAHLLAELVENATIFSSKETDVQVSMQELSSGGVLIEVGDQGIGVSEARLTDMNWRLDNPPTIDVSVSRHMGLFAVARLAERHRVRVRLRPAQPQGLSALVWLPDSIVARTTVFGAGGHWQSPVGVGYAAQSTGARGINGTPEGALALAPNGNGHDLLAGGPRVAQGLFRSGEPEGAAGGPRVAQGPFRSREPEEATGGPRVAQGLFRSGEPEGAAGGPQVAQGLFRGGEPEEAAGGPRVAQGLFRGGDAEDMDRSDPPQWSTPSSPSYDDQTSAGLPIRARKAGLAPDPGSGNGTGGLPQRSDFARGGPPPGSGRGTGSQPLPERSPDQVRSRLAGFQRGTRRAEAQQGQSPRAGEGSER